MQKLSTEDTECASLWGNLYCLTCGCNILYNICCCLGCEPASIIFMGGPKYSCKYPISPIVFQFDCGVFFWCVCELIVLSKMQNI